jgi:hypothetical protein
MTEEDLNAKVHYWSKFVSQQDARAVLWSLGLEGGLQPGMFYQALLQAISRADAVNEERLRQGFSGLVEAYILATGPDSGVGVHVLQAIAEA